MIAFPAFSDPGCSGELSLADDGAISDWTICSRGVPLQIIDSNEGQFKINFFAQDLPQSVDQHWRRSRSIENAVEVFQTTYSDRSIEIRRTFRSSAEDAMFQTISITNMTAKTVMNFKLGLELSDGAMEPNLGLRSLADYVYGYRRVDVALDSVNWQRPTSGSQVRLLAITSRHASLILQSDDLMEIARPGCVGPGRS